MSVVAIHQPNFFPWLGYLDKLARADVFVLLDSVQFPKKGGSWINRVRLLIDGRAKWVTAPVLRAYHGHRSIQEMRIDETKPWRDKLLRTIEASYGRAPYFDSVFPRLAELIRNPTDELARYNAMAITALAADLALDPSKIIIASTLNVQGKGTDLLVEIVNTIGGDAYLTGGGAAGYLQADRFSAAEIELIYQSFTHPRYPQPVSPPVEGLSTIDALMNCGFSGTRELLD